MPDDIWLLPPSYEKDQSAVNDALRELDDFRRKFPDSQYIKKADEMRKEVLKRLVDHEVYIARFYLRSDNPKAAARRLEGAIKRYPGSGREPELLFSLGETYLQMGDPQRAKDSSRASSASTAARRRRAGRSSISSSSHKRYGANPRRKPPPRDAAAAPPPSPANG